METVELIDRYAGALATAMADTAPEAWRILVHGAVIDGWVALIWASIALVAVVASTRVVFARDWLSDDLPPGKEMAFVAILVIFLSVFAGSIGPGVRGAFAPEREALREVMAVVK